VLTNWGNIAPTEGGARSVTIVTLKELNLGKARAVLAKLGCVSSPKIEDLISITPDFNLTFSLTTLSHFFNTSI